MELYNPALDKLDFTQTVRALQEYGRALAEGPEPFASMQRPVKGWVEHCAVYALEVKKFFFNDTASKYTRNQCLAMSVEQIQKRVFLER